jgi:hypothetical protein
MPKTITTINNTSNKAETIENNNEDDSVENDSVNGDNVDRNNEIEDKHNFNSLPDNQLRLDSELVGGLEVRRCSPPPFPRPVMAATGQHFK